MNLLSVKRELEQLKTLARARCGSGCVCEYVEIIEGEAVTTKQEQILRRNRQCYEQDDHNRKIHTGFRAMIVRKNTLASG